MTPGSRHRSLPAVMLLVALLLSGCAPAAPLASTPAPTTVAAPPTAQPTAGAGATPSTASAPKTAAPDKVIFSLDFTVAGRHAPYFVALDRGYYREGGLDVEIVRGQGSGDTIKQVAAGRATLGFADAATLVTARSNDKVAVKEVAIVYQRAPYAIFFLEEKGIRAPRDLEGKSFGAPAGGAQVALFPAYARAAGIDQSKVRMVPLDSTALNPMLLSGQVDTIGAFLMSQPLLQKQAGSKKIGWLLYADAGLNVYSNGIVASDETIATRPDLVRRFVQATIRGLEDALKDPAEAGRILNRYHPEVEADVGQGETEAVRDLALTEDTRQQGLGHIDPKRMERTIQVMAEAFELKDPVKVDDVYATGFVGKP